MSLRDVAVGGLLAAGAAGTAATRSFDWTAISVAMIGFASVTAAALIARSTRRKESQPDELGVTGVLAAWADIVAELQAERDTALMRAVDAEAKTEQAFAERNAARLELASCREALKHTS